MSNKEVQVGGIPIGLYGDFADLLDEMFRVFEDKKSCVAVSVNAEKIISAGKNQQVAKFLNSSDIRYADGIGVVKAIKIKEKVVVPRLPGCELWEHLMHRASQQGLNVFLLGSSADTLSATLSKLEETYAPKVVGAQDGYFSDTDAVIQKIKSSKAQVVTVALGSPKQELFIEQCLEKGIEAVFIGVGGTYDVFSGNVKRAPVFWQRLGLEWLFRLLSQPTRWRRQLNLLTFLSLLALKKL